MPKYEDLPLHPKNNKIALVHFCVAVFVGLVVGQKFGNWTAGVIGFFVVEVVSSLLIALVLRIRGYRVEIGGRFSSSSSAAAQRRRKRG